MSFRNLLIGFVLLFTSCSNNFLYVKDLSVPTDTLTVKSTTYKLQPYDYLHITIKSSNPTLNEFFTEATPNTSERAVNQQGVYYLTSFMVNDSGYVIVPWIGKFYVKGLTLEEAQQLISNKVKQLASDAIVKVKLVSFKVYFIGEMANTEIPVFQDKINILQALSLAGGLPPSADKRKIIVFRQNQDGYVSHRIDLTSKTVFENPYFYLAPNDIVYVPPRRGQLLRMSLQDYSFAISLVSTTMTLVMFFLTLKR